MVDFTRHARSLVKLLSTYNAVSQVSERVGGRFCKVFDLILVKLFDALLRWFCAWDKYAIGRFHGLT